MSVCMLRGGMGWAESRGTYGGQKKRLGYPEAGVTGLL